MAARRIDHEVDVDINITPFTDVVLVLLIIFMIATPLLMLEGMRTNLPSQNKQPETTTKEEAFITISIDVKGLVTVDGKPCPLTQLTPLLRQMIKENPQRVVAIGADAETLYDSVVKVIDSARAAGIERYVLEK